MARVSWDIINRYNIWYQEGSENVHTYIPQPITMYTPAAHNQSQCTHPQPTTNNNVCIYNSQPITMYTPTSLQPTTNSNCMQCRNIYMKTKKWMHYEQK